MTRDEVFQQLRQKGVKKAVVHFSGGNDEGGADSIVLHTSDGTETEAVGWRSTSEGELNNALSEPVYAAYGGFAGDFSVDGEVVWDVEKRTVVMSKSEQVWQDAETQIL
jgi:hypothetical protein